MSILARIKTWQKQTTRCSPGYFLFCAGFFLVLYAVLHALGLRSCMAVLCGNLPADASEHGRTTIFAVLYAIAYLGAVLGAPILILAAGVLRLFRRWT